MSEAAADTASDAVSRATPDVERLRAVAGEDAVSTTAAPDFAVDGVAPSVVVRPATREALSATLREANAQRLGVVVQGGRTALSAGNAVTRYDCAIDMRSLKALSGYEPDDFTVSVEAGMPFADLRRTLKAQGQFLPLDPPNAERASVGGVVAVGRGGVRRARYGTVRDWLIGCSVVLADGTTIKGGGKVVKNVSGYDLPKLFAGSFGTLGCIVEATFKLRPLPPSDRTIALTCSDFDDALALGRRIAGAVNGLDAVVALDAASAEAAAMDGAVVLVRAAGVEGSVDALLTAAEAAAGRKGLQWRSDADAWQQISDLENAADDATLLRCGVAPGKLVAATAAVAEGFPNAQLRSYVDTGLLFVKAKEASGTAIADVRARVGALGGTLTVDAAPFALKAEVDVWGDEPGGMSIMRRIKEAYDPEATLSPGRFVGGI